MHDLQTLTGPEWAGCFRQVLFPLMTFLLNESYENNGTEPGLIEESRTRISTIMSKVFLHHLTPLMTLPAFNDLWLEVIQYLEKFMKLGTDMLYEAVLESLKNMLLVMYSVKAFHAPDGTTYSVLWEVTWNRVGVFLPTLKDELFKDNGELTAIMKSKSQLNSRSFHRQSDAPRSHQHSRSDSIANAVTNS
jgi:golgi-specific brefeldin A-resistance guanine nucleotide exchange factor 1